MLFQIRAIETSLHPTDNGLLTTTVIVELKVTSDLFPGGRLRVACYATVYDVYNKSAKLDFLTPESDPRPERSKYPFFYFLSISLDSKQIALLIKEENYTSNI